MTLASLPCPRCGSLLAATDGVAGRAEQFEDCLRRCETCGVGWSNGETAPRRIWRDPLDNVPSEVRPGLMDAITQALNVRNREMKRVKLASDRSEDAITWTVLQYLARHTAGDAHWRLLLGCGSQPSSIPAPTILVWGVPIDGGNGKELRAAIETVLDRLGERSASRTEPDVVLDFGEVGLVLVEVKYRSRNDRQDDKPWSRYVSEERAFADAGAARASGRYELARNWWLGCDVAGARPLTMVNLVARPEVGAELARTEVFAGSLRLDSGRRFLRLTFSDLLSAIPIPWPSWFNAYVEERGLVSGAGVDAKETDDG